MHCFPQPTSQADTCPPYTCVSGPTKDYWACTFRPGLSHITIPFLLSSLLIHYIFTPACMMYLRQSVMCYSWLFTLSPLFLVFLDNHSTQTGDTLTQTWRLKHGYRTGFPFPHLSSSPSLTRFAYSWVHRVPASPSEYFMGCTIYHLSYIQQYLS